MKPEVGKFYQTRCGRKARVTAISDQGIYRVRGLIFDADMRSADRDWTIDGHALSKVNGAPQPHETDLVAEWSDPPALPDPVALIREMREALRSMQAEYHHIIGCASSVRQHDVNALAVDAIAKADAYLGEVTPCA